MKKEKLKGKLASKKEDTLMLFKSKFPQEDNELLENLTLQQYDHIFKALIENKDLKMIMHISLFDTLGPQATSVEFSLPDTADNSIGAKMASAGANTLMGMGTVFAVLIFISLIISCFKVIPKITEARANKNKKANITTEEDKSETVSANETVDVSDDLELIAVIASAIAASENTSTDSFVVRSIRRR